ncbi:MAG: hypothetical protein ACE5JF_08900, partial [Anaerolineales bacterium]
MSSSRRRWVTALATILLLLGISMAVILLWLGLQNPVDPIPTSDLVFTFLLLAFPIVGWLIAVRRPRNPLGWIFLAFLLILGIGAASDEFALRAARAGTESTAAVSLIIGGWFQLPGYLLLVGPVILLFPDGRVPSNRFRWALWGLATLVLVWGVMYAIGPETVCVERFGRPSDPCALSVENPLGVFTGAGLAEATDSMLSGIFMLTIGTSVTGILVRYRRSAGEVRQQIKWVAWMAVAGSLAATSTVVSEEVLGLVTSEWANVLSFSVIAVGLPVAIAVSIFKYRLYEIDRIISRTAAYALVAAVLVAVFVASVTLTQMLLPVEDQFGIVVSTLVVAAVFNPLRVRVQNAVDRRFNRSQYDARLVLDEFSSQLRDVVDLEQMQVALL